MDGWMDEHSFLKTSHEDKKEEDILISPDTSWQGMDK